MCSTLLVRRPFARRTAVQLPHCKRWSAPWTIVLIGCGVVGRSLLLTLSTLGWFHFILVDPKRYTLTHVLTAQCTPQEVGNYKVAALARLARANGCSATPLALDIAMIGEGLFGQRSLLISAVDSLSAQLAANRIARRMRLPLVRLNTAPSVDLLAVRVYATHRADGVCVACGLSQDRIREVSSPRRSIPTSTYGCGPGSSALLAHMTALVGRDIVQALGDSRSSSSFWWNREFQLSLHARPTVVSRLTRRASCECCKLPPWENLIACGENAETGSLRQLVRAAVGAREARARIRFCHRLTRRAHCPQCGFVLRAPNWLAAYSHVSGVCPNCRYDLIASGARADFSVRALGPLLDRPVRELGLPPGGIVSVRAKDRAFSFVIGGLR